jgi:lysophospholipase L1-like esterase
MNRSLLLLTAVTTAISLPASTATARQAPTYDWSGAWAASPHHAIPSNDWFGYNWSSEGFTDQSVRQVVRVSAGGSHIRIRLSNRYGSQALRVAGATIARAGSGAALQPGTIRRLTFAHRSSAAIPAGAEMASDAVALPVSALESLSVTVYFAGSTGPATFHDGGLTTTFRAAGDHLLDPAPDPFAGRTTQSRYFLTGVDVSGGPRTRGTVVAFGDSITDGHGTTANADNRYPDQLAERIVAHHARFAVVNAGINGNKLLTDSPCYGEKGVARFHRDVLAQPGVRSVVVLAGINDIGGGGYPDFGCGASPVVSAGQVIQAHRALIGAAQAQGVRIIGATLTPMKGYRGYDSWRNEKVRDAVNRWIRSSGEYDAVVDLDRLLVDPARPDALRPLYDSGDHLHLNDAGADAVAAAIKFSTL